MPSGLPPLSRERARRRSACGSRRARPRADRSATPRAARRTGSASCSTRACRPRARSRSSRSKPPAANEGVQFVMPTYVLPASTEQRDLLRVVLRRLERRPAVVAGSGARRLLHERQPDPSGSAEPPLHLQPLGPRRVVRARSRPSARGRAAAASARASVCEPTDLASCGGGICTSEVRDTVACIGYGPAEGALDLASGGLAGAQTAQQYVPPRDGVYREVPLRGLLYWNSHAFNLTTEDHEHERAHQPVLRARPPLRVDRRHRHLARLHRARPAAVHGSVLLRGSRRAARRRR